MADQPSLFSALIAARRLGQKNRGPIAFVPVRIIFLIVLPLGFYHLYVKRDILSINDQNLYSFISAVLVVYGLFGAATIQSIVQIQQITTQFPFSDFLKKQKVFDIYNALPLYVFLIDMASIFICCLCLIISSTIKDTYNGHILILLTCNMLYCAIITYDLLNVIRGLAFHTEEYNRLKFEIDNEETTITPADDKI